MTADPRIEQIRAVLDEDAETRERFKVDVSTSYGPRFLTRIRAILDSAPPDSETEWGYRVPWGVDVAQPSEAAARQLVDGSLPGARVLVRREVGPWTEVQP